MTTDSETRQPDLVEAIARSIADILRPHLAKEAEAAWPQLANGQRERAVVACEADQRSAGAPDDDLVVFDKLAAKARNALVRRDPSGLNHSLRVLVSRFGLPLSQSHPSAEPTHGQRLATQVAGICVDEVVCRGIEPGVERVGALAAQADIATEQGELFSVVAAEYLRLRGTDREEGMRGQTINQNKATFRMFVEVNGDLPFKTIVREHTSAYLGVLEQLPATYSKSPEWRGMTLQQVAAAPKPKGTVMLAKKTQGRHFAALGGLFKHLISRKGYEGANPALGFGLKPKRKARNERPAWTPEDLAQLFGSPIWTGCVSERRRSTPGHKIYRNAMYWLPILCVFHGARLEEFAQLRRRDVRREADIWYFNVTDEAEGQLKNEQSRRQVPLTCRLSSDEELIEDSTRGWV